MTKQLKVVSSARAYMVKVLCDGHGCGAVYEHVATHVDLVRELAAKDGWRHRKQTYATSNWARSVDLCPACPDDKELEPR